MNDDVLAKLLARFPCKELDTGNVRTCPVRLSYPFLFKKAAPMEEGKEPKYMTTMLFPRQADIRLLHTIAQRVAADKFGSNWEDKNVILPFRDGAEKSVAKKPGYGEGVTWFRSTSDRRPDVVDRYGKRIEDADKVYGGCWALVTLNAYGVQHGHIKRVTFGLSNVMHLLDDERLGGGVVSAAQEFEPVEDLDDIEALMTGDAASKKDELEDLLG